MGKSLPPEIAKQSNKRILAYLRSIRPVAASAPESEESKIAAPERRPPPPPARPAGEAQARGTPAPPRKPAPAARPNAVKKPTPASPKLRPTRRCFRAKVVVVGNGFTGKTSLLAAASGVNSSDIDKLESTDGVELVDWIMALDGAKAKSAAAAGPDDRLELSCWDFAGQDVYYATHQFFLSDRAVYVLVLNPRTDGRLKFWLRSVHARSPAARVLVVATHLDEGVRPDATVERLSAVCPSLRLSLHQVCARPSVGEKYSEAAMDEFRQALREAALDQPHMGFPISSSWLSASRTIREKHATDGVSTLADFVALAERHGVADPFQAEALAGVMHHWGHLLHFSELGSERDLIVLRPPWLSDVLRTVVTTRRDVGSGQVAVTELRQIWQRFGSGARDTLVELLVRFELAFRLRGGEHVLLPCLLSDHLPDEVPGVVPGSAAKHLEAATLLLPPRGGGRRVARRYVLDVVPANLFPRLLVRLHRLAQGATFRAYKGLALLESADGQDAALVVLDEGPMSLTVQSSGLSAPEKLLSEISSVVESLLDEDQYRGLDVRRLLGCPRCHEDAEHRGELPHFFTTEACDKWKSKGHNEIPCTQCMEMVRVANLLDASASASQLRRRKTDWLDLVSCEKMRAAAGVNPHPHKHDVFLSHISRDTKPYVRVVANALLELGLRAFFDRDSLPGKELAPGIAHAVLNSHLFVAVLSPRFPESKWCVMEVAARLDWGGDHMCAFYNVARERDSGQVPRALMSTVGVSVDESQGPRLVLQQTRLLVRSIYFVVRRDYPGDEELKAAVQSAFKGRARQQSDPAEAADAQARVDAVARIV